MQIPIFKENKYIDRFLTENDIIKFSDGIKILDIVNALTMSQNKSVSKKDRKKSYYEKMRQADPGTIVIKYCDRIDNLITVHHFSQNGFKLYIEDTEEMIEQLKNVYDVGRYSDFMLQAHSSTLSALFLQLNATKEKYREMYETI